MQIEIPEDIAHTSAYFTALRRSLHRHPELGFEEHATAQLVVEHLERWGYTVTPGIATTGVVGTLRKGTSARAIALRADMDALAITESNAFAHCSTAPGRFHGCGHDGHTAMLLAAAEPIARLAFDGTVHLVFQPAEEGLGGAQAMLEAGLFERFPCDTIFGMHNLPGLAVGRFALRAGPMLAGSDRFTLRVYGQGGHVGTPHRCIDPVLTAAQIVAAWPAMLSRRADPTRPTTVSVTRIEAGEVDNAIPDSAVAIGSIRTTDPDTHAAIETWMRDAAQGIAAAYGARIEFERTVQNPPLINDRDSARVAAAAAAAIVGAENVDTDCEIVMGAEDFAYLLRRRPGAYVLIGNGEGRMVHDPHYDFNDAILPIGAAYWTKLVETCLV